MSLDVVTYALCKKIAASAVSGIKSYEIDGCSLVMQTNDGQKLTIDFPTPVPKDIDINEEGQIVFTLGDGSTIKTKERIPSMKISKEEGNALSTRPDGLYVAPGNVSISKEERNALTSKEDGLFVEKEETATKEEISEMFTEKN